MYPMIIDQYFLHFEICLLAVLLVLKLDECILKTIIGALVPNNFARYYLAEAAKKEVEIFIC